MILTFLLITLTFFQQYGGPCGCEDKPQVNTLAVVNGIKITKRELGSDAQNKVSLLQNEVIKARDAELDLQINRLLLGAEAKRRGITPEQLLQFEVVDKVPDPTEAELRSFYHERKERIPEDYKTAKPQIISLLRSERERIEATKFANALRSRTNVRMEVQTATPPDNEQDLNRVFARVGNETITSRDIEASLLPLIFKVQQQVYAIRKDDLDLRINDMLLEQEAKRLDTTPALLLAKEIRGRLPIITDQQAKAFYNQNKAAFNGDFDKVKFQIIEYLGKKERDRVGQEYAAQLRANAAVQLYLLPPDPPTFRIATDDQPSRGKSDAAVTLVQFTDFDCSSCAQHYFEVEKLFKEFGAEVKFVLRDYPLAEHQNAFKAAQAAEAARDQDKYWEYVALLFANQSALSPDDLKRYASELGLNRTRFDAALDNDQFSGRVHRDMAEGLRLGITNVPAFFVNGKPVSDFSYQGLRTAIIAALKRTG